MANQTISEITFFISSKIAFHTALPYIKELKKRNVIVHYTITKELTSTILSIVDPSSIILDVDKLSNKKKKILLLHRLILLLFTPDNFSTFYKRWVNQRLAGNNKLTVSILKFIIFLFPKWERKKINTNLTYWISKTIKNLFPSNKIIVVTIPDTPFLLCANGIDVYSILESWDHPAKSPIGYISKYVFLWNHPLKEDWKYYQGDVQIFYSYPIKLNYAIEANSINRPSQRKINRIMYPVVTSTGSDKQLYRDEMNFINNLCEATKDLDLLLFIKPKPNTAIGDLNGFLVYKHVEIGIYQDSDGNSSYELSEEYNNKRIQEMEKCTYAINTGTTFAFDVAAFGLPVVQLKFSCPNQFPILSKLDTFPHLARHFYNKDNLIFTLSDNSDVQDQLKLILKDTKTRETANLFSQYLREWLIPEESLKLSVEKTVDKILEKNIE